MNSSLHSSGLLRPHFSFNPYSFSKKNPGKRKQIRPSRRKPKLRFPKSFPTPLLIDQTSYPRTKLQALESVISKLETSIKDEIYVNDTRIFATLLETCFELQSYDHVIRIHRLIPEKILAKNVGVSSKLIRLYASDGHLELAHQLFDEMPQRNASAFPWNSLIAGYTEKGLYEDALALYFQMVEEDVEPDQHTFPRVLKACGGIGFIGVGKEIHRHVIRCGLGDDGFVLNALVDMYAKCGDIVKARKVFDRIMNKDLVSWNSMLIGCIRHELLGEAFIIFQRMVHEGFLPDSITLSAVLTCMSSVRLGTQIHGWILRHGLDSNLSIANSLICFYSSCNRLEQVDYLFEHMPEKDVISWNSVIASHSKDRKALEYFQQLVNANVLPDAITFVSLLSACAHLGEVEYGERFFRMMRDKYKIKVQMEHYACMVNVYGREGRIDEAYELIKTKMGDFEAGPSVWGALLYSCYLHSNANIGEIAAKALFGLEPDNEHNFELLMNIYYNVGRLADVQKIKEMMAIRGLDVH
ncbi:hypothetical protein M9H77_10616 [Catharanthus roseus]|uniref:Uncharacterized protein n=1 Tax=Catharanthus roseus TaxID=4058 RepID=A0ACC0BCA0_CATRO|nr:hypothetical protein M9H77_10616 [Catharanthus roseus]